MHTLLSDSRRPTRAKLLGAAVLMATLALSACSSDVGAAKLKKIAKGAHRDAILAAMGTGPLSAATKNEEPRIVNGFRRQMYLTGGTTWEVLWYRDQPGTLADPIVKERETPVVVQGDTLVVWGWSKFSDLAAKINLPNPSRDKERADSIAKSQMVKKPA